MGSINQLSFLPDDYLERKAQRRTNAICAVLFVIVLAGVGSAFTLSERATRRLETEDADVEKLYVSAAKRIEQARQMEEKKRRMMHQAELSATLLERIPRSTILAKITNALPPGVSLLDFQMDSKARLEAGADDAAPKSSYEMKKAARQQATDKGTGSAPTVKSYDVLMKLTAICSSDAQVAAMLSQLSKENLFRDVNLVISEQYKQKGEKDREVSLRKFQIEMTLNNDAEIEGSPGLRLQTTSVEVKE